MEDGWKPIATAPKDGTEVLLYGGTVSYSEGWPGDNTPSNYVMLGSYLFAGDWMVGRGEGHDNFQLCKNPTHWMPLPAPPTTET